MSPRNGERAAYSALAAHYEALNSEVDYDAMTDGIEAYFARFGEGRKPSLVLDLACGTGAVTRRLWRRGYDMIGTDLSEDMLAAAEAGMGSGISSARRPLLLQQDMRELSLYGTVDAAVCCLDGMNYLVGAGDLRRTLQGVHLFLNPGGLFVFDLNSRWKFEQIYYGHDYMLEAEGVFCAWHNDYNPRTKICRFDLTFFEQRPGGLWRRCEETQWERCYSDRYVRKLLAECGFALRGVYDGYGWENPTEQSERLVYVTSAIK